MFNSIKKNATSLRPIKYWKLTLKINWFESIIFFFLEKVTGENFCSWKGIEEKEKKWKE